MSESQPLDPGQLSAELGGPASIPESEPRPSPLRPEIIDWIMHGSVDNLGRLVDMIRAQPATLPDVHTVVHRLHTVLTTGVRPRDKVAYAQAGARVTYSYWLANSG